MSDFEHPLVSTRRGFLRDAAVLSAVAVSGTVLLSTAHAEEEPSAAPPVAANQVKKLDLGVAPSANSPGVVLVKLKRTAFATFHAEQDGVDGTGVIELHGYAKHKFRHEGDKEFAAHPLELKDLAGCRVVEVENSTWASAVQGQAAKAADPAKARKPLRHFIVTFLGLVPNVGAGGVDFECLCEDVSAKFYDQPFADVHKILVLRDAGF